jgi:hypothetical protein
MRVLLSLTDHRRPGTLAAEFRQRRMARFLAHVRDLPRPVRILDIGGEERFWEMAGLAGDAQFHITLFNLQQQVTSHANLSSEAGDAADLSRYADQSFDVAFSNSVIEHLGSFDCQRRMAGEMQRVGRRYWLQTPNRFFPLEPHFLLPGFQFYPLSLQVALMRRFHLGWYAPIPDPHQAAAHVLSHRLLTLDELQGLFPCGAIMVEKALGLVKSFMVFDDPLIQGC